MDHRSISEWVIFYSYKLWTLSANKWINTSYGYSEVWGPIWWASSNAHFYILNNLIHISTHFFTHIYIKNTQTILLELFYQMSRGSWGLFLVLQILWARSPLDWARPTSPNLNKRATNQPYYPNHLGQLSFTFILQLNALWFANTYTGHPYSSFLFIFKSKGISI